MKRTKKTNGQLNLDRKTIQRLNSLRQKMVHAGNTYPTLPPTITIVTDISNTVPEVLTDTTPNPAWQYCQQIKQTIIPS